jgi:hypothetical protein
VIAKRQWRISKTEERPPLNIRATYLGSVSGKTAGIRNLYVVNSPQLLVTVAGRKLDGKSPMTSFALIFGAIPLVLACLSLREKRRVVVVVLIYGMCAVMFCIMLLIALIHTVLCWLFPQTFRHTVPRLHLIDGHKPLPGQELPSWEWDEPNTYRW